MFLICSLVILYDTEEYTDVDDNRKLVRVKKLYLCV